MKIQPYIDKLSNSDEFKDFKVKNPKSYFSAGFFVLDFEENNNLHQIDYYIPEKKKMVTFALDDEKIGIKESEASNASTPMEINDKINIDLDVLKGIVEDEMKNHMVTHKLHKIIAILQNLDGKLVWNLNCITSDMGIIKMHISDSDHSVLKFEAINLFDVVHKL